MGLCFQDFLGSLFYGRVRKTVRREERGAFEQDACWFSAAIAMNQSTFQIRRASVDSGNAHSFCVDPGSMQRFGVEENWMISTDRVKLGRCSILCRLPGVVVPAISNDPFTRRCVLGFLRHPIQTFLEAVGFAIDCIQLFSGVYQV